MLDATTEDDEGCALEKPEAESDAAELGGAELDFGCDSLLVNREVTDPTAVFDMILDWRLSTLELEGAEVPALVGWLDDEGEVSPLDWAVVAGTALLGATLLGRSLFNTALFAATLLALNDEVELVLNVLTAAVPPG